MRSSPALAAALLVAASCASSATTPVETGTRTVTVVTATGTENLRIRQDDGAAEYAIGLPVDLVWKALPAVYDSLGIPLSTLDRTQMIIGAEAHKMRKSLKGVALSRYFDCGTTQIGANADSYEITLLLLTRVMPAAGNTSKLEVTTIANARPVERRQNPINCVSRNTLDAKLVALVKGSALR